MWWLLSLLSLLSDVIIVIIVIRLSQVTISWRHLSWKHLQIFHIERVMRSSFLFCSSWILLLLLLSSSSSSSTSLLLLLLLSSWREFVCLCFLLKHWSWETGCLAVDVFSTWCDACYTMTISRYFIIMFCLFCFLWCIFHFKCSNTFVYVLKFVYRRLFVARAIIRSPNMLSQMKVFVFASGLFF